MSLVRDQSVDLSSVGSIGQVRSVHQDRLEQRNDHRRCQRQTAKYSRADLWPVSDVFPRHNHMRVFLLD